MTERHISTIVQYPVLLVRFGEVLKHWLNTLLVRVGKTGSLIYCLLE